MSVLASVCVWGGGRSGVCVWVNFSISFAIFHFTLYCPDAGCGFGAGVGAEAGAAPGPAVWAMSVANTRMSHIYLTFFN